MEVIEHYGIRSQNFFFTATSRLHVNYDIAAWLYNKTYDKLTSILDSATMTTVFPQKDSIRSIINCKKEVG